MTLFECENGRSLDNPSKQQVIDGLDCLDGVKTSYAYFTDNSNCYIQVGGGPIEFTVEVRHIKADGTFSHWKASLEESNNKRDKTIIIAGRVVRLEASQILNKKKIKELFEAFIDGDKLPQMVKWSDMTKMFID